MKGYTKKIWAIVCAILLFATSFQFMGTKISRAENSYGLENPKIQYMTRDIVEFGHYWQEDTNGDGVSNQKDKKTPIRWQVLERNGDELFLLADKILDCNKYNDKSTSITWENCTLRSWLNSDFYNNAFSLAEKAGIKESNITNPNNPSYGTTGGNNTKDRVFLLSIDEVTSYGFNEDIKYCDQARMGKVTAYAMDAERSFNADGTGWWWLRSPGDKADDASVINNYGSFDSNGNIVRYGYGVRPALRINLSSLSEYVKDAGKKNVAVKDASWDTVSFGSYNGNDLTWRVLNVKGDDAFLLSDKIITEKGYNETNTSITWENCTLRTWLNDDFYNNAFSSNEKSMIKSTNVLNDDNVYYRTAGGNNTTDKVYLLSLSEIINPSYGFSDAFFCYSDTRKTYTAGSTSTGWWLRSPGSGTSCAAVVHNYGDVHFSGYYVINGVGVRPALHIDLSSSAWKKGEKVTVGVFEEQPSSTPQPGSSTQVPSGSSTPAPGTPGTYTVTFNANGGSAVAAQTVYSGKKVTLPADPTKEGFIFDGWYSNSTLTTPFEFNTPITDDIMLYAKWTTSNAGNKKDNPITASAKAVSVKANKLSKKAQKVKVITVSDAKGSLTYKLVKKGSTAKMFKKAKISKKGVITIKKCKLKKGTYKLKVNVKAAGDSEYTEKAVTVTVKIKVK